MKLNEIKKDTVVWVTAESQDGAVRYMEVIVLNVTDGLVPSVTVLLETGQKLMLLPAQCFRTKEELLSADLATLAEMAGVSPEYLVADFRVREACARGAESAVDKYRRSVRLLARTWYVYNRSGFRRIWKGVKAAGVLAGFVLLAPVVLLAGGIGRSVVHVISKIER